MLEFVTTSTISSLVFYIFSVIFAFSGIAATVIGSLVLRGRIGIHNLAIDTNGLAITFIVLGSFLFVETFVICCGILGKSSGILRLNIYVALIIVILEIAILILLNIGVGSSHVKKRMRAALKDYEEDSNSARFWDRTQEDFDCCGINSYTDWETKGITLPISCCQEEPDDISQQTHKACIALGKDINFLREDDCYEKLMKPMTSFRVGFLLAVIISSIFVVVAMRFVQWLAERMEQEEY